MDQSPYSPTGQQYRTAEEDYCCGPPSVSISVEQNVATSSSSSSTRIVGLVMRNNGHATADSRPQQPVRPIYESPRCQIDDVDLFPHRRKLQTPEERWAFLSDQAGSHRQASHVMYVNARWTPQALQLGVPRHAAQRIRELHLALTDSNTLPEWLDVASRLFVNLQHLYLEQAAAFGEESGGSDSSDGESGSSKDGAEISESPGKSGELLLRRENSSRLRRLYVLYRMPHLQTIDGVHVTPSDIGLARPLDPNGQRVRREEWIGTPPASSSLVDAEDDDTDNNKTAARDDVDDKHEDELLSDSNDSVELQLEKLVLSSPGKERTGVRDLSLPKHPKEGCHAPLPVEEKKEEHIVLTPELPDCQRQMQFVSPDSSGACEWSAACGSLSLPYFRDGTSTQPSGRKLRLSFRRNRDSPGIASVFKGRNDGSRRIKSNEGQMARLKPNVQDSPNGAVKEKEMEIEATRSSLLLSYTATPPGAESSRTPQRGSHAPREPATPPGLEQPMLPRDTPERDNPSPPVRIPPAMSLSSPFPMAFRVRAKLANSPTREKGGSLDAMDKQNGVLGIPPPPTCLGADMSDPPPPPPFPRPSRRRRQKSDSPKAQSKDGGGSMGTIPFTRVQSSPSAIMQQADRGLQRGDLPPPFPGRRNSLTTFTPPGRGRRRRLRWEKHSARTTSIIDADESDIEEGDTDAVLSDEENIAVPT